MGLHGTVLWCVCLNRYANVGCIPELQLSTSFEAAKAIARVTAAESGHLARAALASIDFAAPHSATAVATSSGLLWIFPAVVEESVLPHMARGAG